MLWKDNQIFCDVPLPKVEDRPLIVSHPGAHGNYLASWNVMVDHGEPFVRQVGSFCARQARQARGHSRSGVGEVP